MKDGTGRSWGVWPVLVVLLLAVLVPAGCVLWFMNAAIRNERLAVRQKLTDVYRQQLEDSSIVLDKFWNEKFSQAKPALALKAPELFARLVRNGLADSVIVFDESGGVIYPTSKNNTLSNPKDMSPQWAKAEKLEIEQGDIKKAADLYGQIAAAAKDARVRLQAWQAQVRCLLKAGQKMQAMKILAGPMAESKYGNVTDARGRLITLSSQLLELQLMERRNRKLFLMRVGKLAKRLRDYAGPPIPPSQRLFLMQALSEIAPSSAGFDTQSAEALAAEYLETPQQEAKPKLLTKSALPGVWQMACGDGRIVLLYRQEGLLKNIGRAIGKDTNLVGASVGLTWPGAKGKGRKAFLTLPASKNMPGWELAIRLIEDPFSAEARRQKTVYMWIGSAGILVIALLAIMAAHYVGRQVKLARLKNDFIATVSHELKTPLASMRVLVDTLLEGRCSGQRQANEYLKMISRENERLTHLIDNFLTFSRMERNKRAFNFEETAPAELIQHATDSMSERLANGQCKLEVDVAENLPCILADKDAIVTVLINLLDNALKYSNGQKEIIIRAFSEDGWVCFAVKDNGIGMDRKVLRKIFNRFYQVDQTLSRSGSGCGLGLSIVKFILDAHGGQIDVNSRLGKGSTFVVRLPSNGVQRKCSEQKAE